MLEKYHETLACILGNSFLYGSDEQKAKVSKAISEVVNLVMDVHGAKDAHGTYQPLINSS